jgi:uncharacterized protein YndB with AHSA1/START domain
MENNSVIVERIFSASKSTLWKALTERDLMKQWYFDLSEFRAEVGFKFEFTGGHEDGIQYKHLCEITEVSPEHKLVYSWKYDGYDGISFVQFELFGEGEKTRLKLTHSGIETFPPNNPDLAIRNFEAGWDAFINTSLKTFIENKTMTSNLIFDFTIDKETNMVNVKREFAAGLSKVWSAWTRPELLDLWWAPSPWISVTKSMEFQTGGRRLYAMRGPDGTEHWALADYTSISDQTNFKYLDAFCDNEGVINASFPRSDWNVDFESLGNTTLVTVKIKHAKLEDLEMIIQLGFKEGFTIALNGLDYLFRENKI